jgi:hypothetical protein
MAGCGPPKSPHSAEGAFDRREFGLTFNMMLDGRWVVGDQVEVMIELELVEQKQEEPAAAGERRVVSRES